MASFFMLVHSAVPTTIAATALADTGRLPAQEAEVFKTSARIWRKFVTDLTADDFHRLCDEIWHAWNVDSFIHYMTEILLDVFVHRPEVLRSTETIPVIDILSCDDMTEIVRKIAERKVEALNYRSFDDLLTYIRTNLGLPLECDEGIVAQVKEAIEVRNIIAHNGGRVSALFLRRTKRTDLTDGQLFPLNQAYVLDKNRSMERLVEALDSGIVEHFKLQHERRK